MGVERGELIAGRYELSKRLGRGGMGEVWAARDRALHRDIAIKLLDLDGAGHPELSRRFEREGVAAAQINHPNVVALYDRGVHEDMLFLIMEKVEGRTLAEHIHAERPLSLARALEIAGGISTALAAAHQADVIHYDIKPHNVMLTPDGHVKVLDFGIAGFVQAAFSVARSSQLTPAGTVEYGAPEQFLTERGDERSDLYALGGVLFAMLTRQPPFTGHSALAVVRRKLDEEAPRLDALRPDLPAVVTALVTELLQRDPDRRPQAARQVQERLQRLRAALDPADEGTSNLPTTKVSPPLDPRTNNGTRQPAGTEGPFTITWTERLATYADIRPLRVRVAWFATLLAVCVAGTLLTLGLTFAVNSGWLVATMFLVIGVLLFLATLVGARSTLNARRTWSLQIGPQGIRTGGPGGPEIQWKQVKTYAIDAVLSGTGTYRAAAGIHIRFTRDMRSKLYPPAGWAFPQPAAIRNRLVPVCVLGPMTDQQQASLRAALDRYGHGKSDTEAWGE
ncbi:Serine/threonine protein kinase [Actinacidiphila yanglinensis]|uniref:Serine/threonine protein kinase n=1 Tax=Actinacidiphila yanglinensis TaxID=310779 RepID=A0A1H6E309_9ACTN|nr:protein kinase [Actinacidiphila yanglinensis]SEG92012.1 Serine/threonine protein kinase [Actinacidiphila yanglinensis]